MFPDPAHTLDVSPAKVAGWLALPVAERPRLIDCREADEVAICRIAGCEWLPLGKFPESLARLCADPAGVVVVYCHHGMRSQRAATFLRASGVPRAFSMTGGIDAWSILIDPQVPRY